MDHGPEFSGGRDSALAIVGSDGRLPGRKHRFDLKRILLMLLGPALFFLVYFSPAWPDAVDPEGKTFVLSHEGKIALGLFLFTVTWWVAEVVPIGVTSIAVAVIQVLFLIRANAPDHIDPVRDPFTDFLDPSVWFILASLTIGMVFTKTGLTRRIAYKMLVIVGERTSMILLGCFVLTSGLTLIMAHTAVAATVYPLFLAIHSLYTDEEGPTKFGKNLFMGMAYVAGAGSIITLLGAARGAVAIGFFRDITERSISFFELTWYMFPVGLIMTFLLWIYFMFYFKPEKKRIPGLRERAKKLYESLGPITVREILTLAIVASVIILLGLRSFFPDELGFLNKSAVILTATVLFFAFKILKLEDLEEIPWNIILLFGGAMSIGFCLWQTGAAEWLAVHWLTMFEQAPWFLFVMGIAFFVLIMTNAIMNVAAIAISLPVALLIAPYLDVSYDVVLYASLVTAGMPFLLLVGAAPNAIAYASGQFTTKEFFVCGIPASILLMIVLGVFVLLIWPLMGMPVLL
jgi:sodium-dependent dicarboxylate transporter 2/3/5